MDDVDQDPDYELREQSPVSEEYDYADDVHLFHGGGSRRKPHHYTVCFFPVASLLPAEIDRFALYQPDDHLNRFRPLPPPLSVGAGTYTETRFYTITPVRSTFVNRTEFQRPKNQRSETLAQAMDRVSQFCGQTILEMAAWEHYNEIRVRVRRRTRFREQSASGRYEDQIYDFNQPQWESHRPYESVTDASAVDPHPLWWKNLDDLWRRTSDRAYHEVQSQLTQSQTILAPVTWFNDGIPDVVREDLLRSVLRPVQPKTLPEDERTCPICREQFNDHNHEAVHLPCNSKHTYGFVCIKKWYHDFQSRTCPSCRAEIQLPEVDWSDYQDDWYRLEIRYRDFQGKWDRVCQARIGIPISMESLLGSLRDLIVVERKQAPRRQPLRFNAGYFEETGVLCQVVRKYVHRHRGQRMKPETILTELTGELVIRLRADDWDPPAGYEVNAADGFFSFAEQTIRRMLVLELFHANDRPSLPVAESRRAFEAIASWFSPVSLPYPV